MTYNVNLHNAIDDLTNFVRFLFDISKGPHIGCGFICFYGSIYLSWYNPLRYLRSLEHVQ